ncbi:MAG TPA: hypothetical protein VN950_26060 [Terriglobales bacterium]|jgi:hypothetical protein|nr:hypothetical protein [Terriglobales bacterium]
MKRAALGFRMHSGWGVLVAVSGDANSVEVINRRRIVITDPTIPGANQPYHHAASLGLSERSLRESEKYLAGCAAVSERLAFAAIEEVVRELERRDYSMIGSAVLLAAGRPLPPLAKILGSHPLLHTAEGQFFRNAAIQACQRLNLPVTEIRERELEEQAVEAFGRAASRVQRRIATVGSSIGPPWTKDHKTAALAASMILAR